MRIDTQTRSFATHIIAGLTSLRSVAANTLGTVSALSLVLGLCATPAVHAQDLYVSSDRTIAGGNPINGTFDTVRIGRDSSANNYDNIHADVTGGTYNGALFTYNTSTVNVTGGDFKNSLLPQNASTMNFGGTANAEGFLAVFQTATLNVTGGTVHTLQSGGKAGADTCTTNFGGTAQVSQVLTLGHSVTNITGGTFDNVDAEDNSTVNISGGVSDSGGSFFASVAANNNSTVNVTGGTLKQGLFAGDTSTANITGGIFINGVSANDDATVNFGGTAQTDFLTTGIGTNVINVTGGTISGTLYSPYTGAVNISGGTIGEVQGYGSAIHIAGGIFAQNTLANIGAAFGSSGGSASAFTLFGTGLTLSHGTAGSFDDGFGDSFGGVFWDLKGTLQNGDTLNTHYFDYGGNLSAPTNITGATILATAAPEPGTLALIGCILLPIISFARLRQPRGRVVAL